MPELPEVEVSRLGITPHLVGQKISAITVRQPQLRWLVPQELQDLVGCVIIKISRRAKYLLIETERGTAIVHLGMSGSLRILSQAEPAGKHDHVDLEVSNGTLLRYNDPRRFGSWLWAEVGSVHKVLSKLGPEPLSEDFCLDYLVEKAKNRKTVAKQFVMNNAVVVGVGNIYASEALFLAGIHPMQPIGEVSEAKLETLLQQIKQTLTAAIEQGGTTLKDFTQADGKPGYFSQKLHVYGRAGEPCLHCATLLTEVKIAQRNSFYCEQCQKLN
ncbi:MAG: bifunctional DNA-formamidopyrimidine glycosylase/DNA-(apurinic or apyrimidinic site) lyase [Aliivibrio sp.]|uniref:bifunctional DNA-formamidopyrimidine glycosylase/DNA-(apurinic or apyrimidinic site) lyase n=1 Tax=Aliivibrio sp. TaxID=1872443 RepID=UPI001A4B93EC|nr:bifunctional DNA-formamidopyrimidine glycosylase/DNA-(apurinic or apyrimidinic site) lyase [Aliivibrio sp.]